MILYTANRDIEIFGEDANSFNPNRKLKSQQNLWGLTFGIGLHMCFGRDLDGGVSPNQETDPSKHQYGVVTLLIKKLFEHNVRRDPKNKPERDIKTERPNWGKYPVIFGEKK
jgi:Cytochrome P450